MEHSAQSEGLNNKHRLWIACVPRPGQKDHTSHWADVNEKTQLAEHAWENARVWHFDMRLWSKALCLVASVRPKHVATFRRQFIEPKLPA